MRVCIEPVNQSSATGTGVFLSLLIHPVLNADLFHMVQISYNVFVVYDTVFYVYGNEVFKALAWEIIALEASNDPIFLSAGPEAMTAIYASRQ